MDQVTTASPAPRLAGNLKHNTRHAPPLVAPTAAFEPSELEQCRAQLTRYAQRFLGDRDVAEDVVQDTLLAALQAPLSFEQRSTMRTWLFGILKHKMMDAFRLQARQVPLDEEGEDDGGDADRPLGVDSFATKARARWGDPEQALNQKRFFEALERCIDRLSPNAARVFTMREVLGMDTDEICAACSITPTNCLVILHRARNTLRDLLEERDWSVGTRKTSPRTSPRARALQ
jgi:RNA polymerase sigma-70 factor (ECF subfamily)